MRLGVFLILFLSACATKVPPASEFFAQPDRCDKYAQSVVKHVAPIRDGGASLEVAVSGELLFEHRAWEQDYGPDVPFPKTLEDSIRHAFGFAWQHRGLSGAALHDQYSKACRERFTKKA